VAARFHNTVAAAVVETAGCLQRETGLADVVLTGGVFQNRCLLGKAIAGLTANRLRPHFNSRVPANDAGISLGQAFILRARLSRGNG
jgi:hydrogenase maturation protein HypF